MTAANDNPAPIRIAYTIKQACEATGATRSMIYDLFAAGRLRRVKIGSRTFIPKCDLDAVFSPDADAA